MNSEHARHRTFLRRSVACAVLAFVISSILMIALAVTHYPAFASQPGAPTFVIEPVLTLLVYAVVLVYLTRRNSPLWNTILPTAILFGLLAASIEVVNLGIENGIPFSLPGPIPQITFMLTVFMLWGIAGARTAHVLHSIRAGIYSAILSAAICMLIAVTAGFLLQLFFVPPDPAYVAIWAEFKRSGWTDPRAFGLADTLDSGFTHLLLAPIVATVFGAIASFLSQRFHSKPAPLGT